MTFIRQAVDKYVEYGDVASEGRQRSNLADTLRGLSRLGEARREIHLAIGCKEQFGHVSEPWKSWDILADIEADAGNPAAAVEAKRNAIAAYLAYRRDGGENHTSAGRICLAVTQTLLGGKLAGATAALQQHVADPDLPSWLQPFIRALQAIVAGSRDHALADSEDLTYTMAAEILVLIEMLDQQGR